MSIASEITRLQNAKASIKVSIENKGVTVGDGIIDTYASKIDAIETGITPTGTINITENGTYDVSDKASANVNVDADVSDYFGTSISNGNDYTSGLNKLIKKVPNDLVLNGKDASFLFNRCSSLTEIPLLNTSNVTNMKGIFYQCEKLTTIPQLDTSNVTDMQNMFSGCSSLTTIPLLNTSNVTNMKGIFYQCEKLTTIPQLDTSNVTNMQNMFFQCKSLTTIPLLDISNTTSIAYIFYQCEKLTTIPQLDTSNVTNMGSTFYNCSSLTEIPLLNTSKVNTLDDTLGFCSKLTTVDGFQNLGQAYMTNYAANYSHYKLQLVYCSKLTHDSLMNVINNLYDIATKGCNTQQLVLGSTNMAKLTAEEIAIATNKGWSVS